MTNFKASDEYLRTVDRIIRSFPLIDVDEINTQPFVFPYKEYYINGYRVATDLFSFLSQIPDTDLVVYSQTIQIPSQRPLLRKLQQKSKRHGSMPDPSNKIAKADIDTVLEKLAVDASLLVYSNFNIMVSCNVEKATQVSSYIETKLYDCGFIPSRTAYNQLELFCNSFQSLIRSDTQSFPHWDEGDHNRRLPAVWCFRQQYRPPVLHYIGYSDPQWRHPHPHSP